MRATCLLRMGAWIVAGMAAIAVHAGTDFILTIDHSGSMSINDPKQMRLDAATLLVDSTSSGDRVAVVVFGKQARLACPLTAIDSGMKSALADTIHAAPEVSMRGTDIIAALEIAKAQLESSLEDERNPQIILLTDGKMEALIGPTHKYARVKPRPKYPDEEAALEKVLKDIMDAGVPVHAIALGEQADTRFLRNVATWTGGGYFPVNKSDELLDVYLKLVAEGKNMAAISSPEFYVWPGSKELNVVLFKSRPTSGMASISGNDNPYTPAITNTYWSPVPAEKESGGLLGLFGRNKRPAWPNFYEFVRVDSPEHGVWSVSMKGKGDLQVHALQSVPFDFTVVSPPTGKILAGSDVTFACRLQYKPGVSQDTLRGLLEGTTSRVQLKHPDGQSEAISLTATEEGKEILLSGTKRLTQQGDYICDFSGRFQHGDTEPWSTVRRRIFYVGPADFEIVLESPNRSTKAATPLDNLTLAGSVRRYDTKLSLAVPPANTKVVVHARSTDGVTHDLGDTLADNGKWIMKVLNDRTTLLDPGRYKVTVSGQHPKYSFKPAILDLEVGDWPEPKASLTATLTQQGQGRLEPGTQLDWKATVKDGTGREIHIGDTLDKRWRIQNATFSIHPSDEAGLLAPIEAPLSSTAGTPVAASFAIGLRCSGQTRLKGAAKLELVIPSAQGIAASRQVELDIEELIVSVPPKVTIRPAALSLTAKDDRVASQELRIESWFPTATPLRLATTATPSQSEQQLLPQAWCPRPMPLQATQIDPKSGGPAVQTSVYTIRAPNDTDGAKRFGTFCGELSVALASESDVILDRASVLFTLTIKWPRVEDFSIKHHLPTSLPVESDIRIYFDKLTPWARTLPRTYLAQMFYSKSAEALAEGSVIDNTFVIKEIEWRKPQPDFQMGVEEGQSDAELAIGAFWDEGVQRVVLQVDKLVVGLKGHGEKTRTYRDIVTTHEIEIREKQ